MNNENKRAETFDVETRYGKVKIPVDQYWEDYCEYEREKIKENVINCIERIIEKFWDNEYRFEEAEMDIQENYIIYWGNNSFEEMFPYKDTWSDMFAKRNDDELEEMLNELMKNFIKLIEEGRISIRELGTCLGYKKARRAQNGTLIMQGGGDQIYLSCPMKKVNCNEKILKKLLYELDKIERNLKIRAALYFVRLNPGDTISGGMEGGKVTSGLWVHESIARRKGLTEKIQHVLNGETVSINN